MTRGTQCDRRRGAMDSAGGTDVVAQDRGHRRRPDPARPRRSDGHARRRGRPPDGPCHNDRSRSMRLPDPSPRVGILGIGRRRRRNDRGRLDISSPNVASVDHTEARCAKLKGVVCVSPPACRAGPKAALPSQAGTGMERAAGIAAPDGLRRHVLILCPIVTETTRSDDPGRRPGTLRAPGHAPANSGSDDPVPTPPMATQAKSRPVASRRPTGYDRGGRPSVPCPGWGRGTPGRRF